MCICIYLFIKINIFIIIYLNSKIKRNTMLNTIKYIKTSCMEISNVMLCNLCDFFIFNFKVELFLSSGLISLRFVYLFSRAALLSVIAINLDTYYKRFSDSWVHFFLVISRSMFDVQIPITLVNIYIYSLEPSAMM